MIAATLLLAHLTTAPDLTKAWEYAAKFNSQAMIVMVDGKVVFEQYANGGGKDRLQALASGSKSFCGVVAAAAATDGTLSFDEKIAGTLTDWSKDSKKSQITVRHLLNLSSGLPVGARGREGGTRQGWVESAASTPVFAPGEQFAYGPHSFNIFGHFLETKLKTEKWEEYLSRRVLAPLGVKVEYRGKTADGNPQLAGGAWMTGRDWITFGEFLRNEGKWKGEQLIRAEFLKALYQPSKANPSYGLTFWLSDASEIEMMRAKAEPRTDGFRVAAGAGKQRLYIVPSQNMVAVRLGHIGEAVHAWDDRALLELLTT